MTEKSQRFWSSLELICYRNKDQGFSITVVINDVTMYFQVHLVCAFYFLFTVYEIIIIFLGTR